MEALLVRPAVDEENFERHRKQYSRESCTYENQSKDFVRPRARHYGVQYSHIYYTRLTRTKPRLKEAADSKWGGDCKLTELKDLVVGEKCYIIGTLFKKTDLQNNVLRDICSKHNLPAQPPRAKCISSNDELILEDTIQRISLLGNINTDHFATGIVIALRGQETANGSFDIDDHCFANLLPPPTSTRPKDKYVMMLSGLNVGSSWSDRLSLEVMVDYICGQAAGEMEHSLCSKIVRVILAGNNITDKPETVAPKDAKIKYQSRNYTADTLEPMKELDILLAQLTSCVTVDVMPGSHDPTNYQLPLQPLHKCMFPRAGSNSTLSCVTNPYKCSIDDIIFLGTSGENVDDLYRHTSVEDPLQLLESTLVWGHMAPTSPDTLGCFPYSSDSDPFVMTQHPHVYFAGNQPSFQSKTIDVNGNKVLLVCVPNFDHTHSGVLVNMDTLQCTEVSCSVQVGHTHIAMETNDSTAASQENDATVLEELESEEEM